MLRDLSVLLPLGVAPQIRDVLASDTVIQLWVHGALSSLSAESHQASDDSRLLFRTEKARDPFRTLLTLRGFDQMVEAADTQTPDYRKRDRVQSSSVGARHDG